MEDTTTYTYRYEKEDDEPKNSLKKYFVIVIIAFLIIAIVVGIIAGKRKAEKESETTTLPTTVPTTVEVTEHPVDETYKPGMYSVNTGDVAIRFRAEHDREADAILEIKDKTKLEIVEIFIDESTTDETFKYWGKTKYLGHEGWVTMKYLKKEYSDNIVTPERITENTTVPQTTENREVTSTTARSEKPTEITSTTKAPEKVTEPTTVHTVSKYEKGTYKVATGGYTLRFKREPGRDTEVLASIPDGVSVSVEDVIEINDTGDYRYWGKISYNGHTGYVSMAYLVK